MIFVSAGICPSNLRVYNVLSSCISAPLSEARCSKDSAICLYAVRHRRKAYIPVCVSSKAASMLLLAGKQNRVLRTSKLLPKVVKYMSITRYTQLSLRMNIQNTVLRTSKLRTMELKCITITRYTLTN